MTTDLNYATPHVKSISRHNRLATEKKATDLATEVVVITPDIAAAWLDQNTCNRKMSRGLVDKYATDMAAGHWKFTGDPIRFATNKTLLDGQHRLMACIKSQVPLTAVVIYNLPPETQVVIDSGKMRSLVDTLSMRGTLSAAKHVSAARALLMYKGGTFNPERGKSNSEVLAVVERHPRLAGSVGRVPHLPRPAPASAIIFLHYVATYHLGLGDRADALYQVLKTGIPDYDGDPIQLYREQLIKSHGLSMRPRPTVMAHTMINAWNSFAVRRPHSRARWQPEFVLIAGLDSALL